MTLAICLLRQLVLVFISVLELDLPIAVAVAEAHCSRAATAGTATVAVAAAAIVRRCLDCTAWHAPNPPETPVRREESRQIRTVRLWPMARSLILILIRTRI